MPSGPGAGPRGAPRRRRRARGDRDPPAAARRVHRARAGGQERIQDLDAAGQGRARRSFRPTRRASGARSGGRRASGGTGSRRRYFSAAGPILNEAAARVSRAPDPQQHHGGVPADPLLAPRGCHPARGHLGPDREAGSRRARSGACSIIVAFALRALARWRYPVAANVMIFDEIFDGLDGAGLRGAAGVAAGGTGRWARRCSWSRTMTTSAEYFPATRTITVDPARVGEARQWRSHDRSRRPRAWMST